jgi:transposase-like protein
MKRGGIYDMIKIEKINIVCPVCRGYGLTKVESFFHEVDISSYKCLNCNNTYFKRENILIEHVNGEKYGVERYI